MESQPALLPGFLARCQHPEPGATVITGSGHNTVFSVADTVIGAVKAGALKHIFLMGGCHSARTGWNYYIEFVKQTLADTAVRTLTLVLSWYGQKAVCILLTLLHLGIKNICLGPTLPAFLSPSVAEYLVKHFDIPPTTTPEQDLKAILG